MPVALTTPLPLSMPLPLTTPLTLTTPAPLSMPLPHTTPALPPSGKKAGLFTNGDTVVIVHTLRNEAGVKEVRPG